MRSYVGWRVGEENETFFIMVWKPFHNIYILKLSVSSELGLLQMVLESDTGQCASEKAGPSRRVDCEIPHWLEKGTKHFFIRVWKPLPNRRVLKP